MIPKDETTALTDSERSALADQLAPPDALEKRVLGALRRRGLIRSPVLGRRLIAVAAAILLFTLGVVTGQSRSSAGLGGDFVLLLYNPDGPPGAAPKSRVEEYRRWALETSRSGRSIQGLKLGSELLALGAPSSEGSYPVGLFIIRASSLEEAEQVARSCPHLRYGGEIVIRPIDPT